MAMNGLQRVVWDFAYLQATFPPRKLQLLEGGTVMFDEGTPHGHWEYDVMSREFDIEFHFKADLTKIKRKRFIPVPMTTSFELDVRTGEPAWWAVLVTIDPTTMQPEPVD